MVTKEALRDPQYLSFKREQGLVDSLWENNQKMDSALAYAKYQEFIKTFKSSESSLHNLGLNLLSQKKELLGQKMILNSLIESHGIRHPFTLAQKLKYDILATHVQGLELKWETLFNSSFLKFKSYVFLANPRPMIPSVCEEQILFFGVRPSFFLDFFLSVGDLLPLIGFLLVLRRINSSIMVESQNPFQIDEQDQFDFFFNKF